MINLPRFPGSEQFYATWSTPPPEPEQPPAAPPSIPPPPPFPAPPPAPPLDNTGATPPIVSTYAPAVESQRQTAWEEMPASLKARPDAPVLLDKFLHTMSYESGGGNESALAPGSDGATGVMRIQNLPGRPSPQELLDPRANIRYAWGLIAPNPDVWTDYGEGGATFNGQPFGALSQHPYAGPTTQHIRPPDTGDGSEPPLPQGATPALDAYAARLRLGTADLYSGDTGGVTTPSDPTDTDIPEPPPYAAPPPPEQMAQQAADKLPSTSTWSAPPVSEPDLTTLEEQRTDGGNATEEAQHRASQAQDMQTAEAERDSSYTNAGLPTPDFFAQTEHVTDNPDIAEMLANALGGLKDSDKHVALWAYKNATDQGQDATQAWKTMLNVLKDNLGNANPNVLQIATVASAVGSAGVMGLLQGGIKAGLVGASMAGGSVAAGQAVEENLPEGTPPLVRRFATTVASTSPFTIPEQGLTRGIIAATGGAVAQEAYKQAGGPDIVDVPGVGPLGPLAANLLGTGGTSHFADRIQREAQSVIDGALPESNVGGANVMAGPGMFGGDLERQMKEQMDADQAAERAGKPLPGQGGLFGGTVDEQGTLPDVPTNPLAPGVALPEGVSASDLRPTNSDVPRGEFGDQTPMFSREETGQTGQMGISEAAKEADSAPEPPPRVIERTLGDMTRTRETVPVSDLEFRPDVFQARDADPGSAFGQKRVGEIVRAWDDAQMDAPGVVPDPEHPGKYIVFKGHHTTEAFRLVKGRDAPIEVQMVSADIRDPEQLQAIRNEGDASNFRTAAPNLRESVRTIDRLSSSGLDEVQIGDRLRMSPDQVKSLQDAARLGPSAIDRAVSDKQLEDTAKELGRGMRLYGISEEDANGWFKRIADDPKGKRPTTGALRETIDKYGAALSEVPQGSLFEQGMFAGDRGGILKLIDENARVRTDLQKEINALRRAQRGAQRLAGDNPAAQRNATRLASLGEGKIRALQQTMAANEEDLTRAMKGEAPKPPPDEPSSSGNTGNGGNTPEQPAGPSDDLVGRMIANAESAAVRKPEMEATRSQEQAKRFAAVEARVRNADPNDPHALERATEELRGALAPTDFEMVAPMTPDEMKIAIQRQLAAGDISTPTALTALRGVEGTIRKDGSRRGGFGYGNIPNASEMEALGQVFGPRLQYALEQMGDVWKVRGRVEQRLSREPIALPEPVAQSVSQGEPLSVDVLTEMIKQADPTASSESAQAVAQQLLDGARVHLVTDRSGKMAVAVDTEGLGATVRAIDRTEIPDQLVPPETPSLAEEGAYQTSSQRQVTPGTGETLEVPPNPTTQTLAQARFEQGWVPSDETPLQKNGQPTPGKELYVLRSPSGLQSMELTPEEYADLAAKNRERGLSSAGLQGEGEANPMAAHTGLMPGPVLDTKPTEGPVQSAAAPGVTLASQRFNQGWEPVDLTRRDEQGNPVNGSDGKPVAEHFILKDPNSLHSMDLTRDLYDRYAAANRERGLNQPTFEGEGAPIKPKGEGQLGFDGVSGWQPNKPLLPRVLRAFGDAMLLPFSTLYGLDYSFPLRQGGLLVRNVIERGPDGQWRFGAWPRNFTTGLRAILSGDYAKERDAQIRRGSFAQFKDEVYYSPFEGGSFSQREETFMSHWIDKIPGLRQTERGVVSFLNGLRSDMVDNFIRTQRRARDGQFPGQGEIDNYARYVNRATGRGNLGALEESVGLLNQVFSSSRRNVAMVQAPFYMFNKYGSVRKEAMLDFVGFFGLGMATLGAASLAGADVGLDPDDLADFGKIRVGNTRVDIWGGYQQMARLVYKIAAGEATFEGSPMHPEDWQVHGHLGVSDLVDPMVTFLRNKLSPLGSLGADLATHGDTLGQTLGQETSLGDFGTVGNEAYRRLVPLGFQGIVEALQQDGLIGAGLAVTDLFGTSVNTYETHSDARDLVSKYNFQGRSYDQLTQSERDAVDNTGHLKGFVLDHGESDLKKESQAITDKYAAQEADAIDHFKSGTLDKTLPEKWQDIGIAKRGAEEQLQAHYAETISGFPPDKIKGVTDPYFNIQVKDPDTGAIDFDATAAARQKYVDGLSTTAQGKMPSDREIMDDFIKRTEGRKTQEHQAYDTYIDAKKKAGYFDLDRTSPDYAKNKAALDAAHPDLDAQNWYWRGGVKGTDAPVVHSTDAVDQALKQAATLPTKRVVRIDGLARPVNQDAQSLAAWKDTESLVGKWLDGSAYVKAYGDQEARKQFANKQVSSPVFANLKPPEQARVRSAILENVHVGTPQLDAALAWWGHGGSTAPDGEKFYLVHSDAAVKEVQALYAKYGKTPAKTGYAISRSKN